MTASPRRIGLALLAALIFTPAAALPQEDDNVFVDVVKKDFLDKFGRYRAAKEWKLLFDAYNLALAKYQQKMVQADPKKALWMGLIEYLNLQFADLPKEALDFYREEYDGSARLEYSKARQARDRGAIQAVIDRFFYSTVVDEALDFLGNLYLEERRYQEAVFQWKRLLENYPDSQIPRHLTAARIALAAELWGNPVLLDGLRAQVSARKIDGPLIVAGSKTLLSEYLATLKILAAPGPVSAAVRMPYIPEPEARYARRLVGVRNEIRRWSYDMLADLRPGGGGQPPRPGRGGNPQVDPMTNEFPFIPAATRLNGKSYVVFTNGARVVAVDPTKVGTVPGKEQTFGVYWKYPEGKDAIKAPNPGPNNWGSACTPPFIGVTIDREQAFATLYSEKHVLQQANPQNPDSFVGTTRLACFDVRNREKKWDTDDEPLASQYKKLEFWERNFSWSGPPLVRGDRLYIGVSTSPMGEQESRVLCIDRRTGEVLWDRFLASVTSTRAWWGGSMKFQTSLTMLAEDRGILYAHSNLGVVAALHAVTGNVQWLSKYPRIAGGNDRFGRGDVQTLIRPASPVLLYGKKIYVLPQDQHDMQCFGQANGEREELINFEIGTDRKRMDWRKARRLVGMVQGWMILGCEGDALIVNMEADDAARTPAGRGYPLPQSNVANCGMGAIEGETVYLPTSTVTPSTPYGSLAIYHGLRSWRNICQEKWKEGGEYGNLVVAGNYLIVAGPKLSVFTDVETIRAEFIQRLNQNPPNPQAFLDHGDIMRANDKLEGAAESYLTFVTTAEGDPRYVEKVRDVKTELHGIFIRRGIESTSSPDPKRMELAVEHFRMARGFAYDDATFADAARRLADAYEKLAARKTKVDEQVANATSAVAEYQALIEKSRDSFYKPENSEVWQKSWKHASGRIVALVKLYGPKVYEPVEKAAEIALRRAVGPAALRAVADHYPDSQAAMAAVLKIVEIHTAEQKWDQVIRTLREIGESHPQLLDAEIQVRIHDALEKLGDYERLDEELRRSAATYKGKTIKQGPATVPFEEYATKRREKILPLLQKPSGTLRLPLNAVGSIPKETAKPPQLPLGGIVTRPSLIVPMGIEPPGFDRELEFFTRGSSVELWNLKENKKVWTAAFPGGWFGATFTEVKDGGSGVRITEVYADSPAKKAGLAKDDVVLLVGGKPVKADNFDLLTTAEAGKVLACSVKRAAETIEMKVETVPWPAHSKPGIIGAAYTRDYGLAVAWENCIASLDPATGRVRWQFRGLRDRFGIHMIHSMDGRILAHESFRDDRSRSPHRVFASDDPYRVAPAADDTYSRFLCIDDTTGEIVWARGMPFDPGMSREHYVKVFAPRFANFATVFSVSYRDSVRSCDLYTFNLPDGSDARRKIFLGNPVIASTIDESTGTLWLVDGSSGTRILRNFTMWPAPPPKYKQVEVRLDPKHADQNVMVTGLAANADFVAVLCPPTPATPQSPLRLSLFTTAGVELGVLVADDFIKERGLPIINSNDSRAIAGLLALDADGTLYAYNEPRTKTGAAMPPGERRAFLTAFRAKDGKLERAWEGMAPSIKNFNDRHLVCEMAPVENLVVLYNPKGSMPGEGTDKPIGMVYSKKDGGFLERTLVELGPLQDPLGNPVNPLQMRKGRLFVHKSEGVEVLGE